MRNYNNIMFQVQNTAKELELVNKLSAEGATIEHKYDRKKGFLIDARGVSEQLVGEIVKVSNWYDRN